MGSFEQTMRWFGPTDPVTLADIRQAGATGVVSALHHLGPGQVWSIEEIKTYQEKIEAAGLVWSVVESVPVHEDIKRQAGKWEEFVSNYQKTIRNLSACGIKTICYNFMAVTDWTRTELDSVHRNGAQALRFDVTDFACFDLFILKRPNAAKAFSDAVVEQATKRFETMTEARKDQISKVVLMGLPGTVEDLTLDAFRDRLAWYDGWDAERLRHSLGVFLSAVVPIADECEIKLAIHPDDPPFPIFGLPRVASTKDDLARLINLVPSKANGITFCTGSLGSNMRNNLPEMLREFSEEIHFLHLRSVYVEEDGSFFEDDHLRGLHNMVEIVQTAIEISDERKISLPMRPDHGHLLSSDPYRSSAYPGYTYLGRLKGLAEIRGLELGLRRNRKYEPVIRDS